MKKKASLLIAMSIMYGAAFAAVDLPELYQAAADKKKTMTYDVSADITGAAKKDQPASSGATIACELIVDKKDLKKGDTFKESEDGKIWKLFPESECLKDKNAAEEVLLLKKIFNEVGDAAPKAYNTKYSGVVNIGAQIKQQTFVVNHSWYSMTTKYMGFGPEDDPLYDYKKSDYFPHGSIKINLTERAYSLVKFYYEYVVPAYGQNSDVAKGVIGFFNMLFSHESLHGYQLKTGPVLDFKRAYERGLLMQYLQARNVTDPLFKQIVSGSQTIVNYEEDAINLDSIVTSEISDVFDVAVGAAAQWKDDPALAQRYPLLFGKDSNFYNYYMVDVAEDAKLTKEKMAKGEQIAGFTALTKYTYMVQSEPIKAFVRMVEINNILAKDAGRCAVFKAEFDRLYNLNMELMDPDFNRDPSSPNYEAIKKSIQNVEGESGVAEVKDALKAEFAAFQKVCK